MKMLLHLVEIALGAHNMRLRNRKYRTLILTMVKIMKIMMVLILNVVPIFSIENKVLAKQVVHDILWPFFPTVWGECPVKEALCMIMMMKNWNWVQLANYMPTI